MLRKAALRPGEAFAPEVLYECKKNPTSNYPLKIHSIALASLWIHGHKPGGSLLAIP